MRTVTRLTLIWLATTGVTLPQTGPAPVPKPGEPTVESGSEATTKPDDGRTAADPGEQPALPSDNAPKTLAGPARRGGSGAVGRGETRSETCDT